MTESIDVERLTQAMENEERDYIKNVGIGVPMPTRMKAARIVDEYNRLAPPEVSDE